MTQHGKNNDLMVLMLILFYTSIAQGYTKICQSHSCSGLTTSSLINPGQSIFVGDCSSGFMLGNNTESFDGPSSITFDAGITSNGIVSMKVTFSIAIDDAVLSIPSSVSEKFTIRKDNITDMNGASPISGGVFNEYTIEIDAVKMTITTGSISRVLRRTQTSGFIGMTASGSYWMKGHTISLVRCELSTDAQTAVREGNNLVDAEEKRQQTVIGLLCAIILIMVISILLFKCAKTA